jgi:hypothetical protein
MTFPRNFVPALVGALALVLAGTSGALAAGGGDGSHGGGHGKNHIALFVGATDAYHNGTGVSLGLEYEYRLHNLLGAGLLVEYSDLDHNAWVLGVPFVLHPYKGLRLLVMPGVEFSHGHSNYLTRVGIGYDIPVGDWIMTPAFNVDFVNHHENLVFGVAIGKSF